MMRAGPEIIAVDILNLFLFLSSCYPQIVNLNINDRFQSVINTFNDRKTSTPLSLKESKS